MGRRCNRCVDAVRVARGGVELRYVAQWEWPVVVKDAAVIPRLFGSESAQFQSALKSIMNRPPDSPPICSLDLEFNPERPTVLGLSDGVLHVSVPWDEGRPHLIDLLRVHPDIYWIGHFLISADVQVLAKEGIQLYRQNVTDSAIWHWLTNMHLCKGTGKTEDGHDKRGKGYMNLYTYASLNTSYRNWKECPGEDVCVDGRPCPDHNEPDYNGLDAAAVIVGLPNVVRKARLWRVDHLHDLHRDLLWAFQDASNYGVRVDMAYVDTLQEELIHDKERIATQLPFNPASPLQVVQHFKTKDIKLDDAQEETIRKVIERGEDDDELELLLEYKEIGNGPQRWFKRQYRDKNGWWKGYVDAYDRIHCRLGAWTSSGRMMCADPNLNNVGKRRVNRHQCTCGHATVEHTPQILDGKEKKVCGIVGCGCKSFTPVNIGKKLRRAIIASDGTVFIDADYKNGENMVYMYLAGESIDTTEDFHTWMAGNIGIDDSHPFAMKEGSARDAAKTVTHAQDYFEGIKLMTDAELRTAKIRKEIEMGARLVFSDWKFKGRTVTFTGINLARRALGKASLENRRATLDIAQRYMNRFPKIRGLQMRITAQLEREGGARPPHGYFTRLTGDDEECCKSAAAIWGSQPIAHLLKLSIVDLQRRFEGGSGLRPLLPIHDELLCEWPADADPVEGCRLLKSAMERETPEMPGMRIKAEPSWGSTWRDLRKVEI
jgi:hypothetical protein